MAKKKCAEGPLKILHIGYSLGIGGSQSVIREVALRLQERGHENMVVALEHDGPLSEEFRRRGIPTHAVDRAHSSMSGAMREIARICREFRPDVIHTHHMYILFYTVWGALRTGTPIVHTEHDFWSLDTRKGRFYMPILGRFCDRITGVNDDIRRFMAEGLNLQRGKLVTVPNGIDLRRFGDGSALAREELGLGPENRVAGIVARLEPVKNVAMLLRAWQGVVETLPEAVLLVVGEGSEQEELQSQAAALDIADNVRFLGPRRDVPDLLALMDVAVLTSREEGLPMFLLEAMATGLPVASTAVGGIPDLIRDGEHGRLVDSDDDAALAEALVAMLADPEGMRETGRRNRELVRNRYDLETSVDRYLELYCELAGIDVKRWVV